MSTAPIWLSHERPPSVAGGTRIKHLNLSGNNIGDAGAKALAEMLKVGLRPAAELSGLIISS
jgi:hypothetical protein